VGAVTASPPLRPTPHPPTPHRLRPAPFNRGPHSLFDAIPKGIAPLGRIGSRSGRCASGPPRDKSAGADRPVFCCTPRNRVTRSETWTSQVAGGGCQQNIGYRTRVAAGQGKSVARALASCQAG
jgi:hypothetical protein